MFTVKHLFFGTIVVRRKGFRPKDIVPEEAGDVRRVARQGVEEGGAGQAQDGPDEEEQEDELV